MRVETITCDGCGSDISSTDNSIDYRLVLASERKRASGPGACTDMAIDPPVERPHHFCGLGCLDRWRAREHCFEASVRTRYDAWIEQKGSRDESGRIWAFPTFPQDTLKEWQDEARRAALEAHPMGQLPSGGV